MNNTPFFLGSDSLTAWKLPESDLLLPITCMQLPAREITCTEISCTEGRLPAQEITCTEISCTKRKFADWKLPAWNFAACFEDICCMNISPPEISCTGN